MPIARRLRRTSRMSSSGGVPSTTNILLGKLFNSDAGTAGGSPLSAMTDGNIETRWISSPVSPATATVDMGATYTLSKITIVWAGDCTKNYTVQISTNNTNWTPVFTGQTDGVSRQHTVDITSFSATPTGRYLRIVMTDRWNDTYGNSIWEIMAYGYNDPNAPYGDITGFSVLATVGSDTSLDLKWNYSGSALSKFTLVRGDGVSIDLAAGARSYVDTRNLNAGTTYSYTLTGVYSVNGSGTGTVSGSGRTSGGSGTRNPVYFPFVSESPWNLPVVENTATYDQPSLRSTGNYGTNYGSWSHGVFYATNTDPLVTVHDTNGHIPDTQWRMSPSAVPAVGSDAHMHVVSPDGSKILEMIGVERIDATHINCFRGAIIDLRSNGLGPDAGVRAYGGAAIGGLIRAEEVDPSDPNYTGEIRHALAMAICTYQLGKNKSAWDGLNSYYYDSSVTNSSQQPGWNTGRNRNGFMHQTGYVWPATEQDWNSMDADKYLGDIPMGAYFVIPASVNINALGITTNGGMMAAKAAQDYGVYIVDNTGTGGYDVIYVNYTPGSSYKTDRFNSELGGEAGKIITQLRRVSTNNENNPNGGPLGAARRKPLLPPLM